MKSKAWTELLTPIQSAGVAEAIVRQLGELIGSGTLSPGDRLPTETELAQHFAVSPMTVRNALQVLRDHELVETRRGRGAGTFVQDDVASRLQHAEGEFPSLNEFLDFTVWREAISGEACAIVAAKMTPEIEAELRALTEATDAKGLDPDAYRFADARLHLRIAELTGSLRLFEAERQIQDYLTRSLSSTGAAPDSEKLSAQGHTHLIDAMISGEKYAARERFREHAQATVDVLAGFGYLK